MPKFSVNLIVRNASPTLPTCLASLQDLSNDIVVTVDSRSQDATKEIAEKYTKKVFVNQFLDFASQRNFTVSHSANEWILSLDADEIISDELYQFLKDFWNTQTSTKAFSIKRTNIIFGKKINHTNWDPDGVVRLFDKNYGSWRGSVHETWYSTGRVEKINFAIIHQNYHTVEEFMTKLDTYTTIEADRIKQFSLINFFWLPKKEFIRRYFIHVGFLDGYHGLFLSFLMWIYQVSIWVKVWQKEHTI